MPNTTPNATNSMAQFIGKPVLVRADHAGMHYGILQAIDPGQLVTVHLTDARRLWQWTVKDRAGLSMTDIAVFGIDTSASRINVTVPDIMVAGVCEIVPAAAGAILTIPNAPVASNDD